MQSRHVHPCTAQHCWTSLRGAGSLAKQWCCYANARLLSTDGNVQAKTPWASINHRISPPPPPPPPGCVQLWAGDEESVVPLSLCRFRYVSRKKLLPPQHTHTHTHAHTHTHFLSAIWQHMPRIYPLPYTRNNQKYKLKKISKADIIPANHEKWRTVNRVLKRSTQVLQSLLSQPLRHYVLKWKQVPL